MNDLVIYSDNHFSELAAAFCGEFASDCTLACEIVTVDEDEIRRLNNTLRGIDSVTDVLSFPALENILGTEIKKSEHLTDVDEQGNLFIGSIAICEKRAAEQAEEYGHSYRRELLYLAAHGVCHLLGYDHVEEDDKKLMRALEEKVLAKLNAERF